MYCPNCGIELGVESAYCTGCGASLLAHQERPNGVLAAPASQPVVPWRGLHVALGILLVGLAFLLISASLLFLDGFEGGMAWGAWLGSHGIGVVILVTVWLLAQRDGRLSLADIGLRRPRVSWVKSLLLSGLAVTTSIGATALYAWALAPLEIEWLIPPDIPGEVVFGGFAAFWTFEALSGWTPFTEEIFFRGFVMAGLVARWGIVGAAIGSSLIFAVFHLHPGVLLPIFGTGLLLAALYHLTGSLWPPIIAHATQNAIALAAIIYAG